LLNTLNESLKEETTAVYSKLLAKKYDDGKLSAEEEAELDRVMEGSAGIRDGELGAHIGFAPTFKTGGSLDLEKSRSSNVKYEGVGEMGLIMLDFQWNAMMNSKGYSEFAKPMYDQKMWTGNVMGMEPPTLKTVIDIAVSIAAGIATAGMGLLAAGIAAAAIGLSDDLVFAGIDVTQGYKSPGEVGVELGKKTAIAAASVAVSAAFSGVGKIVETTTDAAGKVTQVAQVGVISKALAGKLGDGMGQVVLDAGLAGAKTLTTSTISSAVSGITYSDSEGFGYSSEAFTSSFKAGLVSSAVSMTSTFVTGALGQVNLGKDGLKAAGLNPEQLVDMQKFNKTVGGLAGQGVNYALGGDFTVNVLNLSMLGIDIKGERLESGLFEVRFGRDGISTAIGTGGVDMSYEMIGSTLLGGLNWGVSALSNATARRNNVKDAATALRSQWGSGDGQAKSQLFEMFFGKTRMAKGDPKEHAEAETVRDENGNRVVMLNRYEDGMTLAEQLALGVNLQHEAHRDGYKVGEIGADGNEVTIESNMAENRTAVTAHTEMAIRMLKNGQSLEMTDRMIADLTAYGYAKSLGDMGIMDWYADTFYDSSADYLKLKFYNDGTTKLIDDGRSSLYIDTANGGEFKLWDMEGLSIEDAKMTVIGGYPQPENGISLSPETMKRLGMYAILNANGLFEGYSDKLNDDTFNELADNAIYTSGLGYYLDFQSIGLALRKDRPTGPTIESTFQRWFMLPTDSYDVPFGFSGGSIYNAFVFGIAEQFDRHVSVNQSSATFNNNSRQYVTTPWQEYHAETEDGNLESGMEKITNGYTNATVVTGNGNYPQSKKENYLIRSSPKVNTDIVALFGNLGVNILQFSVGAANASKIGKSYVSTWNDVLGNDFYTIQKLIPTYYDFKEKTAYANYTFMSPSDKKFNSYVKRSLNALKKGK
jgi:hypothetical protein